MSQTSARSATSMLEAARSRVRSAKSQLAGILSPQPEPRPSLTDLGRQFRTDKATFHNYTPVYEHHFSRLRDASFSMLEIGIGGARRAGKGGASLRMWESYFPNATIVGLDIEDKSFVHGDRIITHQGSQADPDTLNHLHDRYGPFTIIIDDGSHQNEHVRVSFEHLFPLLETGGLYAIEDTQTSYWPEYGGSEDLGADFTMMAMVKELIDGLNYAEFLDEAYEPRYTDTNVTAVHCYHNLVILDKDVNDEPSNKRRALVKRYRDTDA